jgi:hypothetical protein
MVDKDDVKYLVENVIANNLDRDAAWKLVDELFAENKPPCKKEHYEYVEEGYGICPDCNELIE